MQAPLSWTVTWHRAELQMFSSNKLIRGNTMTKFVKTFLNDESGASAAEYALILAIVGSGIALAAIGLGDAISGAMSDADACITAPSAANC
jgi:pilus assembly protein Flp/PilA